MNDLCCHFYTNWEDKSRMKSLLVTLQITLCIIGFKFAIDTRFLLITLPTGWLVKRIRKHCGCPERQIRGVVSLLKTSLQERSSGLPGHHKAPDGPVHNQGEGEEDGIQEPGGVQA